VIVWLYAVPTVPLDRVVGLRVIVGVEQSEALLTVRLDRLLAGSYP
jgi:hypothetical protein